MIKAIEDPSSLRKLYSDLQVTGAEAALAKAQLDLYITRVYKEHDMSPETHAVCLWCGKFVPREAGCGCLKKDKPK